MKAKLVTSLALLASVAAGPGVSAQPVTFELTSASIAEVNAAIDAGVLTSEKLVELCLARIEAYDQKGPRLNAVLHLNPRALELARELDREREAEGRRSPLHGIPVVLKDNFDTADMPTTAGSAMLAGSLPPDDAFLVGRLREAGAIVLAKLNMSELASGSAMSSLGGVMRNPHALHRSPSGSSGGTGIAIAAAYAPLGLGTDTGGSVRGPSTANGIVGLKPTHGLLSRDGIVPLALSFDTAGPMARHVEDIAVALGVLTGIDAADEATRKSEGRFETDYTTFLDAGALEGARLGVLRDFLGQDTEVDWVIEASLEAMRDEGASLVDVRLPEWLLSSRLPFYQTIRWREFRAQIAEYLDTLGPEYPKGLDALVEASMERTSPEAGATPNPTRWSLLREELASGTLADHEYLAVREHALPLVRAILGGILQSNDLDAIVYPTASRRTALIEEDSDPTPAGLMASGTNLANLTGFPDLILPAGFTGGGLPVGISFVRPAFSEGRLLALGYAFERATEARRLPVHAPPLPGESIPYNRR